MEIPIFFTRLLRCSLFTSILGFAFFSFGSNRLAILFFASTVSIRFPFHLHSSLYSWSTTFLHECYKPSQLIYQAHLKFWKTLRLTVNVKNVSLFTNRNTNWIENSTSDNCQLFRIFFHQLVSVLTVLSQFLNPSFFHYGLYFTVISTKRILHCLHHLLHHCYSLFSWSTYQC